LKRFLFHNRPVEFDMFSKIALVDLIDAPQTVESLTNEIWVRVLKSIDQENLRKSDRSEILDLFDEEFQIFRKQILGDLEESATEYQNLVRAFIIQKLENIKEFAEKISTRWKRKNKGLI